MCSTSRRSSRRAMRVAADEPLGEPDHADLEALGERRLARGAERDLDAAAADVDDHAVALREIDAVGRGDVNQPGFLGARDHPDVDAGAIADRGEEVAAVLGLAGGAGRRRDDLVDLVRVGQPPELGERLEAAGHRRRRQRPAVEAAGAEPDHLLLAVDDLEGLVGADLRHDHVHGVGADVDRGQAHGGHSTMTAGHPDMLSDLDCQPAAAARRPGRPPRADDRTPLAQSLGRRVEALAGHLQAALDGDERGDPPGARRDPPAARDRADRHRHAVRARRAAAAPAEAPDRRARPGARAGRRPRAGERPRRGPAGAGGRGAAGPPDRAAAARPSSTCARPAMPGGRGACCPASPIWCATAIWRRGAATAACRAASAGAWPGA